MAHPALILAAMLALQAPSAPFESKEGGFKIAMPSAPAETTQKVPSALGPIDVHFFQAEKEDVTYLVSYSDYPPKVAKEDPAKLLEGAANGAVGGVPGAKLVRKQDRKIGQTPGKEVEFSFPGPNGAEGLGRARLYLTGTRMYSVLVLGPKDRVATSADPYFRSFGLMQPAAATVTKGAGPAPTTKPAMPRARAAAPGTPARPGLANRARPGMAVPSAKSATPGAADAPANPSFVSEAGGFRVAMPGKPREQTIKQNVPDAGPVEVHLFLVQQNDLNYIVTYTGMPGGVVVTGAAAETALDDSVRSTVNGGKATLVSKKARPLGKFPGREFEFTATSSDGQAIYGRSRSYFVNAKFYQLLVTGPKAQVAGAPGSAFLDSFALTDPRPAAAPAP